MLAVDVAASLYSGIFGLDDVMVVATTYAAADVDGACCVHCC